MNNIEYAKKAKRTYPDLGLDKDQVVRFLDEEVGYRLNLAHLTLGLASELGELVNCTGTELKIRVDIPNLKEELGDIYWYLANYCTLRDIVPPTDDLVIHIPSDRCFELLISSIGELVDITKKYIAYNRPIEKSKEMEAVYDIYSALSLFEHIYNINGDEIRAKNIHKLEVRYPEKFTETNALNRNLDAERKTLE
jgi:hypothetical protein